ncbi:AAA family ATPase [Flavobacterium psychrophilum]
MIRKINTLKNFGVFQNFTWDILPEFNEKNIFYGWNYSGKTTISRLLSSLKNKELNKSYSEAEFEITLDDKSKITHKNIENNNLNLLIFNSDYIRENLKWDLNSQFNGITFDVGETIGLREKIEKLEEQILKVNGSNEIISKKSPFELLKTEFDSFEDNKYTQESRTIKNDIFNSLIEFNKSHLKSIIPQVVNDLESNLITDLDELNRIKKLSLSTNDKEEIQIIHNDVNLKSLYDSVVILLNQEPKKNNIIQILEENPYVSNWVKSGIPLHKGKEKCFFCENDLSKERLNNLLLYFNNESSNLRNEIITKIEQIKHKIDELNNIELPKSKFEFFDNFQNDFQAQLDSFILIKDKIFLFYNNLINELEIKNNESIFISKRIADYDNALQLDIDKWTEITNKLINNHNQLFTDFDTKQIEARNLLKKHQVSLFLTIEEYIKKKKESEFGIRCISKFNSYIKKVKIEIAKLESELKSIVKGKDELNSFIQKFLNRSDIFIEVIEDDKFILKRNGKIADNLSEGEKTAISFSYFLVSLESLFQDKKIFDYIICIDDPISSLDGNHIAQIYSLINSFFFRQNINPAVPEQYVNCFKQLFISTHNFEFFSFIKDSNRINKKSTKEYYFIKRISNTESNIQELPKSLRDYKSEYIYLFDLIFKFFINGCQETDEKLILMPNAVRRFLEIYTLMKLPDSTDQVDERIRILMPEHMELKTLHHFSHFTTFEKVMKHDEIILNLSQAIGELMTLLGKDELHFESLKRAVTR